MALTLKIQITWNPLVPVSSSNVSIGCLVRKSVPHGGYDVVLSAMYVGRRAKPSPD